MPSQSRSLKNLVRQQTTVQRKPTTQAVGGTLDISAGAPAIPQMKGASEAQISEGLDILKSGKAGKGIQKGAIKAGEMIDSVKGIAAGAKTAALGTGAKAGGSVAKKVIAGALKAAVGL
jgi:hypothetical protein